jgi:hypothetical protein
MPRRLHVRRRGQVDELFCTHTETRGGSSETGVNVLTAIPHGAESTVAPMNTIPEG